jgi:hypothetical protein
MKSMQRRSSGSKRWTLVAALSTSLALFAPIASALPGNGNGPPNGSPGNGNGPPNGPGGNGGPPSGGTVSLSILEGGLFTVAIVSLVAGVGIVRVKQKHSRRSRSEGL